MRSVFTIALLLGLAVGRARSESVGPPAPLTPVRVRLAAVQAANLPQLTEIAGTVRPVRHAVLAARVMGSIAELSVALGQAVRSGDVLLRIDSADLAARLALARTELNAARRDFERERDLHARGASTSDLVRRLEDRLAANEATVRDATVQLGYAEIRAPFDGVIARKLVQAGDLATPGQPLFELEGTASFEIEVAIPESLAGALAPGTALECTIPGAGFTGMVREISSTADAATRSVGVKIDVPAGAAVRSGQFARILVPGRLQRTLLVPTAAVSVNGQMERVFVAADGSHAVLRLVKTGAVRGDRTEVLAGLAEGERVVVAPPPVLRDGQPLEIAP